MMAVGCAESGNEETNSQDVGEASQTTESSAQAQDTPESTATSVDQDAEWIALMQNQSSILQNDLTGIGSNQNPFDAEGLAKWGQTLVDDTQEAIDENDKYVVSPALTKAKEHWEIALRNYNTAGQFTVIGANAYLEGDEDSASTNFQKATTFFNTGNGNVNLTVSYMETQ